MQLLGAVIQCRGLRSLTQLCIARHVLHFSTYEFTDNKFIDKVMSVNVVCTTNRVAWTILYVLNIFDMPQIRVKAKAGDGGSGCDSIWKSNKKGKYKSPDGGNGGRGGDVIVEACSLYVPDVLLRILGNACVLLLRDGFIPFHEMAG